MNTVKASRQDDCAAAELCLVYSNNTGDEGATALAEAIKTNNTLTLLDLKYSRIGDEGATDLAEAIKTNTTLTTLDLRCNSIGDAGASVLAEALMINMALTSLDLWGNRIGLSFPHLLLSSGTFTVGSSFICFFCKKSSFNSPSYRSTHAQNTLENKVKWMIWISALLAS